MATTLPLPASRFQPPPRSTAQPASGSGQPVSGSGQPVSGSGQPVSGYRDDAELLVARLGMLDYQDAWDLQRRLVTLRREDRIPDTILLLEHPHTYTLGRRGKMENILLTPRQLARRKIAVYEVDRGGDVTYHGPEQLVGYPILRMEPGRVTFVRYIRELEIALLAAVRDLGVPAGLQEGFSGVWVANEKICAIGVKVDATGITSHGFALNVNTDLSYFGHIIPCGITDKGVASLAKVLGRRVSMRRVQNVVVERLAERFGLQPAARAIGPNRLGRLMKEAESAQAVVQRL